MQNQPRDHIVVVEFETSAADSKAFARLLLANARHSRELEPGCLQFDVCIDAQRPGLFFLYEAYRSRCDFDAHLQAEHFRAFAEATVRFVVRKDVRSYERIDPEPS